MLRASPSKCAYPDPAKEYCPRIRPRFSILVWAKGWAWWVTKHAPYLGRGGRRGGLSKPITKNNRIVWEKLQIKMQSLSKDHAVRPGEVGGWARTCAGDGRG